MLHGEQLDAREQALQTPDKQRVLFVLQYNPHVAIPIQSELWQPQACSNSTAAQTLQVKTTPAVAFRRFLTGTCVEEA